MSTKPLTKTITLTEEAYARLKAWKGDRLLTTFSEIVLAKVPKRGTFGDLATEMDRLPPLSGEQGEILEKEVRAANDWSVHENPWTT